jgi:hypothetical protein
MNGSESSSSSAAAGAELTASAGASSLSLECADADRFSDPEDFNAEADEELVVAGACAWAGIGVECDAWAAFSALRLSCAAASFLKSTAGAVDS